MAVNENKAESGANVALLCMDGSKYADYAFKWYLDNVHRPNDSVVLLHCVEFHVATAMPAMGVGSAELLTRLVEEQKVKSQKYIDELKNKMKAAGMHGKIKQTHGLPREEILRVAEEEKATIIITGTRGMGTVRRTLLGSVSDHVLHHSHVPVLVCKHEDDHHHHK